MDWPALIGSIGASTMGVVSVITQKPIPAPQPTSILSAAVGGDLSTIRQQEQTTGILMLALGGLALFLLLRK